MLPRCLYGLSSERPRAAFAQPPQSARLVKQRPFIFRVRLIVVHEEDEPSEPELLERSRLFSIFFPTFQAWLIKRLRLGTLGSRHILEKRALALFCPRSNSSEASSLLFLNRALLFPFLALLLGFSLNQLFVGLFVRLFRRHYTSPAFANSSTSSTGVFVTCTKLECLGPT